MDSQTTILRLTRRLISSTMTIQQSCSSTSFPINISPSVSGKLLGRFFRKFPPITILLTSRTSLLLPLILELASLSIETGLTSYSWTIGKVDPIIKTPEGQIKRVSHPYEVSPCLMAVLLLVLLPSSLPGHFGIPRLESGSPKPGEASAGCRTPGKHRSQLGPRPFGKLLDTPPRMLRQPLHEDVVQVPTLTIHADLDPLLLQHPGKGLTGELRPLIGVEYLRSALA